MGELALSGWEAFGLSGWAVSFPWDGEHAGEGDEGEAQNDDSEHLRSIARLDTPARWILHVYGLGVGALVVLLAFGVVAAVWSFLSGLGVLGLGLLMLCSVPLASWWEGD